MPDSATAPSSRWSFRPPLWAWLGVVAACTLMGNLGLWQLNRGEAKELLLQRYLAADAGTAEPLTADQAAQPDIYRKVIATGRYLADRQLLLDNQTLNKRPGVHAWTPLRLGDGSLVMVNRGWLPLAPDRSRAPPLPAPEGEIEIAGFWRTLPQPGMRMQSDNCADLAWPRIVQYPTVADLACLYPGERIADGLLLLSPEAAGGFEREWNFTLDVPPSKHYGYALQWFAFTATLLALFLKLNLKRKP